MREKDREREKKNNEKGCVKSQPDNLALPKAKQSEGNEEFLINLIR